MSNDQKSTLSGQEVSDLWEMLRCDNNSWVSFNSLHRLGLFNEQAVKQYLKGKQEAKAEAMRQYESRVKGSTRRHT